MVNNWGTFWTRQSNATPNSGNIVPSIWANGKLLLIGASDGVFKCVDGKKESVEMMFKLPRPLHSIKGSAKNNVAVACDDGSIWHFNGSTWKKEIPSVPLRPLYSIAVTENTIVAVGTDANYLSSKAVVVVGRRN